MFYPLSLSIDEVYGTYKKVQGAIPTITPTQCITTNILTPFLLQAFYAMHCSWQSTIQIRAAIMGIAWVKYKDETNDGAHQSMLIL